MNITVAYRSRTGHSKRLAVAIAEAVGARLIDIKQQSQAEPTDVLFIVGGIYGGKSAMETLEFALNTNPDITKHIALVTSSASNKSGQVEIKAALRSSGLRVIDEYRCLGGFLFLKLGHPNQEEIANAVTFAKNIIANLPEPSATEGADEESIEPVEAEEAKELEQAEEAKEPEQAKEAEQAEQAEQAKEPEQAEEAEEAEKSEENTGAN